MTYQGIDYGKHTGTNRNPDTGIHYGVISTHSLGEWINEVIMNGAYYGEPTCPSCDGPAIDNTADCVECEAIGNDMTRKDYHCHACGVKDPTKFDGVSIPIYCFWSDRALSEEMLGWSHEADGYKLTNCPDNDVFVIESPYYTYAAFCSPCIPGAGNLDSCITDCHNPRHGNPCDSLAFHPGYPKTYCFGHDWFEDGKAPYRVFKVSDGTEVLPTV